MFVISLFVDNTDRSTMDGWIEGWMDVVHLVVECLFLHFKDIVSLPLIPTDAQLSRAAQEKTILVIYFVLLENMRPLERHI